LGPRLAIVLIDANILAYLLIHGEQTEAAQRLRRSDPDWRGKTKINPGWPSSPLPQLEPRVSRSEAALLQSRLIRWFVVSARSWIAVNSEIQRQEYETSPNFQSYSIH
jgi:hypothetical protein